MKQKTDGNGILIVGGYGHVGRLIALDMAPRFPERVVVAGRNGERAQAFAEELGNGARGIALDAADSAAVEKALEGMTLVISCIDQEVPHLLRSAVTGGLAYIDISAELDLWERARELEDDAKKNGARVLIGSGLVPGTAGVMAREAVAQTGPGGTLDVGILLSIGDNFGAAALNWMIGASGREFTISENGRNRQVRAMAEKRRMVFPDPFGQRTVMRFAIPDQVYYPETLGVRRAGSWVALEPGWIATFFSLCVQSGLLRVMQRLQLQRGLTSMFEWLQRRYEGRNTYALTVKAEGPNGTANLYVIGRDESQGTAVSAVTMADTFLEDGNIAPGVWLPEQIFEPASYFATLENRGIKLKKNNAQPGEHESHHKSKVNRGR
ncbi:saccharopine dehydrogenase family protein [Natronogracilivirga saccharolytica]|uniref:Saccharopine dehydrogenase NADP-binding domain-containing protein n=1 Tax=Natronogracilivirga saccharolytica TaxID=2812953 RepID=A0A8J7RLV3_9BACT|nr:saccharopine dehydrogenase NADP-binding domain-containing protein [Natronogracilivirga saccharolytica]MBP3192079.1 saccharopine dehydrogenase NADP-binding domain-containing protein [Natronogracilivirga saccharolytica]